MAEPSSSSRFRRARLNRGGRETITGVDGTQGYAAEARHWAGKVSKQYRSRLLDEGGVRLKETVGEDGVLEVKVVRNGMKQGAVEAELV